MSKSFRILNSNLNAIFSFRKYIWIFSIFIFILIFKIDNLYNESNSLQCIKIMFYGPINLSDNTGEVFIWSIYQFYLLYIVGDYIFKEFSMRNTYTIGRIGSKTKWNSYMQISIFLTCIIYYFFGFVIEMMGMIILNKSISSVDILNILNIFLILTISSYFIATTYYIILLIHKNHSLAFIMIVIYAYLSIMFGAALNIDIFLPINHGILSKHYFVSFGFGISYLYLGILIIINLIIINKIMSKKDIVYYMN
ncbi:hypothetical protein [Clostridium cibarium]|uniref:ABC-2 family transporter protein n=1 Tax=Clostridium cibarium TaxID=2762247 RepID=A0ABR8PVA4_9CLOT|nr:hypothetical protein [Clostridium cibarium]MBD7912090.1 hypothetical protein [Clostridium cibarium]